MSALDVPVLLHCFRLALVEVLWHIQRRVIIIRVIRTSPFCIFFNIRVQKFWKIILDISRICVLCFLLLLLDRRLRFSKSHWPRSRTSGSSLGSHRRATWRLRGRRSFFLLNFKIRILFCFLTTCVYNGIFVYREGFRWCGYGPTIFI